MAQASRRVDTVTLTMDIQEAKVLAALLYTSVAGSGPIRQTLTDGQHTIASALQTVMDSRFWAFKERHGEVNVTDAELTWSY